MLTITALITLSEFKETITAIVNPEYWALQRIGQILK